MPAKAGALAGALQIDLVGPERDPVGFEYTTKGNDQAWILDQIVEDGIEMVKGLDHANRLRSLRVFELDRRLGSLDITIAVDSIIIGLRCEGTGDPFGLDVRGLRSLDDDPLRGGSEAREIRGAEHGFSNEEALVPIPRPLDIRQLE